MRPLKKTLKVIAGSAISRKTAIPIETGVLQSESPKVLLKNGGSIKLTTKWACEILKSMEWSKRRGTTAKREMEPCAFKRAHFLGRKISQI